MRIEVRNQILMLGKAVAVEVEPTRTSHRRWLWLGPCQGQIELREVEVPFEAEPEGWSTRETDPVIVLRESFPDLDGAIEALWARGIETDGFDAIWKNPNPF